jgi:tripeptide aminopeptidase
MKYYFEKDDTAIKYITKAYNLAGVKYSFNPIRGGTDGARITYMGLPCPNIGTGDRCCHGRYEHVVVEEMYEVFEVVKTLLTLKQ